MAVKITKPSINIREKLSELDKPAGIAGEAMLRAETPQEQFNLIGAGRKNLIINGGFDIWQRGTSITGTYGNRPYTSDRWQIYTVNTGATATVTRSSDVPSSEFLYSAKFDASATTNRVTFTTTVELPVAGNIYPFKENATYTLSAWVKTDDPARARVYTARFASAINAGQQNCTVREIIGHTGGGGWEKVVYAIDIPTSTITTANQLRIMFSNKDGEGSNQSIAYYTGVQLEHGKVATPFEHRSYGEELVLCKRYYQRLGHSDYLNNFPYPRLFILKRNFYESFPFMFEVEMRDAPTITASSVTLLADGSGATLPISGLSFRSYRAGFQVASTGTANTSPYEWHLHLPVIFDAEL